MRTELTATLAGGRVRGRITVAALLEVAEHREDLLDAIRRCLRGEVRDVRAVLVAALRAQGELRRAEVEPEVDRLIEEAGLAACGEWAAALLRHAFDKAAEAQAGFGGAEAAAESPFAPGTFSASPE